jgi:hypothetical protein
MQIDKKMANDPRPVEVIVHRAHNERQPENSLNGINEIRALSSEFMIEIDICVTRDNVLVVHHDLSLDRLCNVPTLVSEIDYGSLPLRIDGHPILRLEEVLERYPDQQFFLDLHTDKDPVFFPERRDIPAGCEPADKIINAAKKALKLDDVPRLRLCAGTLDHALLAKRMLPDFTVDIAERYFRDGLDAMIADCTGTPIDFEFERVYMRYRYLTVEKVAWCHERDIKIFANHQVAIRSTDASLQILKSCIERGIDGLVASPLDRRFIKTFNEQRENLSLKM